MAHPPEEWPSRSFGYEQVNVVTCSGGDQYHGDLYDIFANNALNAHTCWLCHLWEDRLSSPST
ncbi:MAG: hypothetical protein BGO25_16940 [Acidobacteriales bacterium 59-55]|nr:hypothetical protein [Terriglobales bacterium]OJV41398.1 MAG: hypothetical protein BGO25_16940 [Acidobacteriales bacterium 59-55]